MKRWLSFVVAALTVVFMQISFPETAEAARVAVVPIQINNDKVVRASDFNNYYWDIMIEKFPYPDYELIDDSKIESAIPYDGLKTFDKDTLAAICDKTDGEIVVVMRLDAVRDKVDRSRQDAKTKYHIKGAFAGYNRLTGKYYYKKINYNGEIETALTLKNDWQQDAFTSTLKRCLNRMMDN